jgi:protein-S-isoprenylcysteine O-methyltransferase Ste14
MKLSDHMVTSGDVLFRWRSYVPLVLLPLLLLPMWLAPHSPVSLGWKLFAAGVALAGEALRFMASGLAPEGTSERSTTGPRASALNTSGIYSIVRHPLYIANTVTMLGLALFPARWTLPVIVLLASVLYYERIAMREEAFLDTQFGQTFRDYAARVPAIVPRFDVYTPSTRPFSLVRAVEREFNGILAIAASLFLLDLVEEFSRTGSARVDHVWTWLLAAAVCLFVVMVVRKQLRARMTQTAM